MKVKIFFLFRALPRPYCIGPPTCLGNWAYNDVQGFEVIQGMLILLFISNCLYSISMSETIYFRISKLSCTSMRLLCIHWFVFIIFFLVMKFLFIGGFHLRVLLAHGSHSQRRMPNTNVNTTSNYIDVIFRSFQPCLVVEKQV